MLAKEIHIQFDLVFQSMNSKVRKRLESQEIDWVFNEAAISFVKERTNPKTNLKKDGFQDTVKRYEDVEQLISTVPLPLYLSSNTASFSQYTDTYYSFKPFDHLNYIPENGFAIKGSADCPFDFSKALTTSVITGSKCIIPFPDTEETSSPFYNNFILKVDGVTVFDATTIPSFNGSILVQDLKFYLVSKIIETINNSGSNLKAYWCKYGKDYHSNSLIIVSTSVNTTCQITYGGSFDTSYSFTQTSASKSVLVNTSVDEYPCRLIKTTERRSLLNNSFGSTKLTSPIVSLEDNIILVHHKKRFISDVLLLSYVRKPRKIDLLLDIGSELSDDVCFEIINLAVRKLINRNESSYQNIINENALDD